MKNYRLIQWICFLHIVFFISFICITKITRTKSSFSLKDILSLPNYTRSSNIKFSNSRPISATFRNQLIDQRMLSHLRLYENGSSVCEISQANDVEQNRSFHEILSRLHSLRQEIVPYPNDYFHDRGIVLTVGLHQLIFAKINLKLIELTGTRLPVQIWYSVIQVDHRKMISLLNQVPKLNASVCCFHTEQCRTRTEQWQLNSSQIYKPRSDGLGKKFPYKPAAIISATFKEVLFLDSDAYVTRDPEELFSDPMYLKFGALFHSDAYKSRQNPFFWKILNTSCAADEYELDSATILVNKKHVWNGLYLTKLINDNHQQFYTHVTDGDKDTFRIGFRFMNIKYYIVSVPCATGSFNGTHFCGKTLCKTDSLAQHIYVNHIHLFKYEDTRYTRDNLAYTRIGLSDLSDDFVSIMHCQMPGKSTTCFQIMNRSNPAISDNQCHSSEIRSEEIEEEKYMINQPLLYDTSRKNRILISKTDHLIPDFLDYLLKYLH